MTLDEYRTACGLSHNAMARELEISINTMAHYIAEREKHDRQNCPICKTGAIL